MKITFSPMRSDAELTLARAGDVLIINGAAHDFAGLAPGNSLSPEDLNCDWFAADPYRDDAGRLHLRIVLPHGAQARPEQLYPAPVEMAADGPVPLP